MELCVANLIAITNVWPKKSRPHVQDIPGSRECHTRLANGRKGIGQNPLGQTPLLHDGESFNSCMQLIKQPVVVIFDEFEKFGICLWDSNPETRISPFDIAQRRLVSLQEIMHIHMQQQVESG
jgi:hypothetical protein